MAIRVRLTPGYGFLMNEAFYDRKTGVSLTSTATSADLENMRDLTDIYRAVLNGRLQLVDGTLTALKTAAGSPELF